MQKKPEEVANKLTEMLYADALTWDETCDMAQKVAEYFQTLAEIQAWMDSPAQVESVRNYWNKVMLEITLLREV